ncbi:hypothetical protein, partial [Bacillus sp. PS06]|uniref:hypothetical protein n=1 Tax=Bacillus sp. PS06 TaxID=2764176 RepID=UPI001CD89ED0
HPNCTDDNSYCQDASKGAICYNVLRLFPLKSLYYQRNIDAINCAKMDANPYAIFNVSPQKLNYLYF